MKLWAISDLHLGIEQNRTILSQMAPHPEDWLILAGDIGETEEQLHFALETLLKRFARIIWTPGNHDLWTTSHGFNALRGEQKYHRLVAICRSYGVLTPEDDYPLWPGLLPSGQQQSVRIVPILTLYDYSFRPTIIPYNHAVSWAAESEVLCADEELLEPQPFASRTEWCHARCAYTEQRLAAITSEALVLAGHFPLRYDLIRLPRIPRFSIWCGTRRTENWHQRFPVLVSVYGHLHIRATDYRDGVRFEEVSLGYPRHYNATNPPDYYLREILPGPTSVGLRDAGPFWRP